MVIVDQLWLVCSRVKVHFNQLFIGNQFACQIEALFLGNYYNIIILTMQECFVMSLPRISLLTRLISF